MRLFGGEIEEQGGDVPRGGYRNPAVIEGVVGSVNMTRRRLTIATELGNLYLRMSKGVEITVRHQRKIRGGVQLDMIQRGGLLTGRLVWLSRPTPSEHSRLCSCDLSPDRAIATAGYFRANYLGSQGSLGIY